MTMQASEKLFLQTVGRFVSDRFKAWTAPIIERVEKIEALVRAPPVALTAEQGEEVCRMIADRVERAFEAKKFASHEDLEKAIAAIPAGPPGKDGTNGVDGMDGKSITAADLGDLVGAAVADAVAGLPDSVRVVAGYVDRAGDLYFTNSDGSTFKAGHVAGDDADPAKIAEAIKAEVAKIPPPKDGKDGFALTDFEVVLEGRTLTFAFKDAGGNVKTESVTATWPIYKGVWIEGSYLAGDSVTHEGSTWIAHVDTATRPGTPDSNWQLAVKRGRDGKEGKAGKPGEAGTPGRDGRDLTQLGPDGKKW